jgi:hypothetical protein
MFRRAAETNTRAACAPQTIWISFWRHSACLADHKILLSEQRNEVVQLIFYVTGRRNGVGDLLS